MLAQRCEPVLFNSCGKSEIKKYKEREIEKLGNRKIDPCGTAKFISPASEKTPSNAQKSFLFKR